MIGIVLVSHSNKLAEGVKELAAQMVQNKVLIETAAGIDDDENPIGTDPMKVTEAIEKVYQDDDVLVLMDLGSALMNAQMGIEFLPEDIQKRVHLCSAPIVEGGLVAAVQAMLESPIEEVIAEAQKALQSKIQLLNLANEQNIIDISLNADTSSEESLFSFEITVPNAYGLHARPASKIVYFSKGLDVDAKVSTNNKEWHNAKSINNLSLLGAKKDDILYFRLKGSDAEQFKEKLQQFQTENFGDDIKDAPLVQHRVRLTHKSSSEDISGIPSSSGIALAKAVWVKSKPIEIKKIFTENPSVERAKFVDAIQKTITEITNNKTKVSVTLMTKDLEIFDAHIAFLEDFELQNRIFKSIEENSFTLEKAWYEETEKIRELYQNSPNEYTQQRASDIKDIQTLFLKQIIKMPEIDWSFKEPVILLADNLQPSETLKLNPYYIKGFLLREGNDSSHTSILARSLGIPAISALGVQIDEIEEGKQIYINGDTGIVLTNPNDARWEAFEEEKNTREKNLQELKALAFSKAKTTDGLEIEVLANIAGINDSLLTISNGADGVGLFRTELFFMNNSKTPSEEEQYDMYCRIAKRLDDKPLTIRTLDIGGDKPISYLPMEKEENPFLGLRGIRYSLANKTIFREQVKAILRASANYPIQMMFPMISSIKEWHEAMAEVILCKDQLKKENKKFNDKMLVGMMVEVPSVVLQAEVFAKEVDFFSIGTNDLSQYMFAADRGNSKVKGLISNTEKSICNAIQMVCDAAHKFGKPVSVCGEMATKESAIPQLIKCGVRKLSVNAPQIPLVKKIVNTI